MHPTRDFSYVSDTVNGFIAAAHRERAVGQVINLGSNFEISIGDTTRLIAELMGRDIEIQTDDQRKRPAASEVERLWADNRLARDLLDWSPEYAGRDGFARALQHTIEWFAEPGNLSRYKHLRYNI